MAVGGQAWEAQEGLAAECPAGLMLCLSVWRGPFSEHATRCRAPTAFLPHIEVFGLSLICTPLGKIHYGGQHVLLHPLPRLTHGGGEILFPALSVQGLGKSLKLAHVFLLKASLLSRS